MDRIPTPDYRLDLERVAERLAYDLAPAHEPLSSPFEPDATPDQQARYHLALLHTLILARRAIDTSIDHAALNAGETGQVTYADLGQAAGISRQSARQRWPDAVPAARPGRPRSTPKTAAGVAAIAAPAAHGEPTDPPPPKTKSPGSAWRRRYTEADLEAHQVTRAPDYEVSGKWDVHMAGHRIGFVRRLHGRGQKTLWGAYDDLGLQRGTHTRLHTRSAAVHALLAELWDHQQRRR